MLMANLDRMASMTTHPNARQLWDRFCSQGRYRTQVDQNLSAFLAQEFEVEPKSCFYTAQKIALFRQGYRYVEGFGMTTVGIPLHHAWLEMDGVVVDPVWYRLGGTAPEYFGVEIPLEMIQKQWIEHETSDTLLWHYLERVSDEVVQNDRPLRR